MNKGIINFLFVLIMTVFIASNSSAQEYQNQLEIKKKNSSISERRDSSLLAIEQLIVLYQKVSSDLRSEIKNIKSEQENLLENKSNTVALNLANRLDKFAQKLTEQKEIMEKNAQSFIPGLKEVIKIIENAMAENQPDINFLIQMRSSDASNYTYAASQLSKKEHDLYSKIITNLKA